VSRKEGERVRRLVDILLPERRALHPAVLSVLPECGMGGQFFPQVGDGFVADVADRKRGEIARRAMLVNPSPNFKKEGIPKSG
jgi:hypothetical protein